MSSRIRWLPVLVFVLAAGSPVVAAFGAGPGGPGATSTTKCGTGLLVGIDCGTSTVTIVQATKGSYSNGNGWVVAYFDTSATASNWLLAGQARVSLESSATPSVRFETDCVADWNPPQTLTWGNAPDTFLGPESVHFQRCGVYLEDVFGGCARATVRVVAGFPSGLLNPGTVVGSASVTAC